MKRFLFLSGCVIFLFSCSEKSKNDPNVNNTYNIVINADSDSLKDYMVKAFDGKASYFSNKGLEIVSNNFLTEEHEGIHYYKVVSDFGKDIKEGTRKIELTITGKTFVDSTSYSMPKFVYRSGQWNKTSDVGVIKATLEPGLAKRERFYYSELIKQIRQNVISSTHEY